MISNTDYELDTEAIAIVGIGIRFPGESFTPEQFWNNLLNSFDGIVEVPPERWTQKYHELSLLTSANSGLIPLDEWKKFDPLFFGMSPKEAADLDPQERMVLKLTYEALEDAQIPSSSMRGSRTGVFVGVSNVDNARLISRFSSNDATAKALNDTYTFSVIANRISYCFDLRGPSMCVDTACSSSLITTDLACQSILSGNCDMAITGGINAILHPDTTGGYSMLGVLGDKCRSFDADGKGFVRAEGCGMVILKRLSQAEKDGNRIYAVIRGGNTNTDGRCNKDTMSTPSSDTQSENITRALRKSMIDPASIYYVEAHATGTVVGDPIEVTAISKVFSKNHSPERPLKIGSVKSNMGHLESCAGVASLIKVSLMLKNRQLVPNINFKKMNPKIKFKEWNIDVVTQVEDLPTDRPIFMGINSFGIGGANCHMVLGEYREDNVQSPVESASNCKLIVPISANSSASLDKYIEMIVNDEGLREKIPFKHFALHQTLSKSHLTNRKVVIAKDWQEFVEQKTILQSQLPSISESKKVIFVFCGQGPQWNQMGMSLYESQPAYKAIVDKYDGLLKNYTGYSIIGKMNEISNESNDIHKPINAQPSLFLFQIGLFELYKQWGIHPSIVVGHSFGDITCAYISGSISLETAIKVVHYRSLLQNETIGTGRMLVVGMSESDYQSKYAQQYPKLEIACFNGPASIVITGDEPTLNQLVKELKENQIFNTFLRTPCSFHSSHQKMIKSKIFEALGDIECSNPVIPWYSTVTGTLQKSGMTAKYLYDNIRRPVYFEKAMKSIAKDLGDQIEDHIFVEIAPHPTLSNLVKESIPSAQVLSPIVRNKDEDLYFKVSLAALHCHGVNVQIQKQFTPSEVTSRKWKDSTSILPRYQWDDELYWTETAFSKDRRLVGPSTNILGNFSTYNGQQCYTSDIDIKRAPYKFLNDHQVKGKPLFPGAGYAEAIIEAFKSRQNDIIINRLNFLNPFFLSEAEIPQKMQTFIDKQSNNDFKIDFFNKTAESFEASEPWVKTAHARVSLASSPTIINDTVDIESFKKLCNLTTYNQEEFYQHASKVGLKYGTAFQHVREMMVGPNQTFAKLAPRSAHNTPQQLLNTTLIDNCVHGMMGMLEDRRQFVFKSIQDMRVNIDLMNETESNLPNELYLLTTLIDSDNNDYSASCLLVVPDGRVLLEMERFTVTTPQRMKMKKTKFPRKELMTTVFQPKHSPLSIESAQLKHGMVYTGVEEKVVADAVAYLCFNMMENLPGFCLEDVFQQTLEESLTKYGVVRCKSNDRLFARFVELFKNYQYNLNEQTLNTQYIDSLVEKYKYLQYKEDVVLKASSRAITQVLLGNTRASIDELFKDHLLDNFYTKSPYLKYHTQQLAHILTTSIKSSVEKREKRIIKILEVGGGLGTFTHKAIAELDNLLKDYDNECEVYYYFTDISPVFLNAMKEKYEKEIQLKSELKIRYKLFDIEKDSLEQGYLPASFDFIVMAYVIHIAPDIVESCKQIQKLIAPNGLFAFVEPNYKFPFVDLIFGGFQQIWNYSDEVRDHFTVKPEQWIDILSSDIGFSNTKVLGTLNGDDKPIPLEEGHSYIIISQKSSISSIPIPAIKQLTLITNEKQSIPIDTFKQYSQQPIQVINSKDIDANTKLLMESSSHILFLCGIDQLTFDNYQSVTFDCAKLFRMFMQKSSQPMIGVVTRSSQSTNYYANSLNGIVKSAFVDIQELNLTYVDIDRELNEQLIKSIFQVSTLGDNEYFIKNGEISVEKCYSNAKQYLKSSVAYEQNPDRLGCRANLNVDFKLFERPDLKPDEIEFEIKACGINFKDYLFHLQILTREFMDQGDVFHPPIGLENGGVVTRVGSNVHDYQVGDEVYVICSQSLASHSIQHRNRFLKKPKNVSFAEVASIQVTYGTVYHSLVNICDVKPEDTVLVHSASGGIGLAALNILRWKKCKKVFATAGSKDKIEYLKANYSDILIGVFDSHTTDFARAIKRQCKGADIVLNTLSSDYMNANFKSLSTWGKVVDVSLTHVYNHESLDYGNFKNDHTYVTVDYTHLAINRSMETKVMLQTMLDAINCGELHLPKIEIHPITQSKEAILSLKERKHIGKITIDMTNIKEEILNPLIASKQRLPVLKSSYKVDISNTVITTGQQGISLELIHWLATHSKATDVVVLSISALKSRLRKVINTNNNNPNSTCKIHFIQSDVTNKQQLHSTLQSIKQNYPPIESIFHLAAIYDDIGLPELTLENIQKVHQPKVKGSINLHELTLELQLPIKRFFLFSSISSLSGTTAQPSYNSANLVIDAICRYRTEVLGLPARSLRWGPLLGEGHVAESVGIKEYFLSRGVESLQVSQFIGGIEALVSHDNQCNTPFVNQIISDITTTTNYEYNPKIKGKLEHLVEVTGAKKSLSMTNEADVYEKISNSIATLLSTSPSKLNGNTKLKDFGVDSLMTVQIKSFFDTSFEKDLFNVTQIPSITINQIVSKLYSLGSGKSVGKETNNSKNNSNMVQIKIQQ